MAIEARERGRRERPPYKQKADSFILHLMKPTPSWAQAWRPVIGFPVALIVLFLLIVAALRMFPMPVGYSVPRIVYHGDSFDVESDVTNHTHAPVTRTLGVWVGFYTADKSGGNVRIFDHREIVIALRPVETKRVHCTFPNQYGTRPLNFAEARWLK